ncbi:unnamed protein product [Mytilus coruscus]|uniref:Uncharacterized protein n=1 Tax=Mytilus coruscus TaxID=42192 RepID=A0A6J8B7N5_MYTCO|nr:unnamed protein product [Mytilus coruscus]
MLSKSVKSTLVTEDKVNTDELKLPYVHVISMFFSSEKLLMVCSIIAESVLVLGMFSLRVIGAILRNIYESKVVILMTFMTVLLCAEVVVAIMATSYCCCCSAWGTSDQQGVSFVNDTQPGLFLDLQQINIPMANVQPLMENTGHIDIPTVSYPRANQYQENTTNE